MSDKTIKESWIDYFSKKKDVLYFYKTAMCIDGDAEFVEGQIDIDCCIKCTDSKRGVFYITTGKKLMNPAPNDELAKEINKLKTTNELYHKSLSKASSDYLKQRIKNDELVKALEEIDPCIVCIVSPCARRCPQKEGHDKCLKLAASS